MTTDDPLMALYRRTTFEANTPQGRISLRPGDRCSELDALLDALGVETWAHITAWNPGPTRYDRDENDRRQQALEAELEARGLVWFPGRGVGDDGWTEEAALVLGLGQADALELGARFAQRAVVWGRAGGPATLLPVP